MSKYYPELPYIWFGKISTHKGMVTTKFSLTFHNNGKKKYYVLYQHVPNGGNFQLKEFPQVYNKALILDYMKIKRFTVWHHKAEPVTI